MYIADNLAYFPYLTQDEPLFIINQIDIIVSVSGSNLLQSFKEVRHKLVLFKFHLALFGINIQGGYNLFLTLLPQKICPSKKIPFPERLSPSEN